jgi:hypothetical protein
MALIRPLEIVHSGSGAPMLAVPTAADVIRFERTYDTPASRAFDGSEMRLEWLAFIAFSALLREGKAHGDFEAWFGGLENVRISGSDDDEAQEEAEE